jgi:hypothetical protein
LAIWGRLGWENTVSYSQKPRIELEGERPNKIFGVITYIAYMNSVELVRKQCYITTAVVKASHLLELARENHDSCKGRPDHL